MPVNLPDTVRLTWLRKIKELYEAAVDDETPPTGKKHYGLEFGMVTHGPLADQDNRRQFSVGIVAGREMKSDLYPLKTSMCEVNIEFRAVVNKGDPEPSVFGELVMGVVQQVIYDNQQLDGLVIKCDEKSNEIDILTYTDKSVRGVVTFMVHYRHGTETVYEDFPT